MNLHGVEAEEQVLTEAAFLALLVQVGVGGGEQPHVHLARLRRTDTFQLARLQHAQQFGLLAQRHVGDLVQEERAMVGQFETANAIGPCVGESALHVAEDLTLKGAFGQRAGVHGNE